MFLKYYGVDWIVFALVVTHLWLLTYKCRSAFLVGAFGTVFGVTFGFLVGSAATVTMNVVFCIMHLLAYRRWSRWENLG